MRGVKVFTGAAASVLLLALMGPLPALADTIEAALVRAYQNNPQLNAQRAIVRATDEGVPQALSGYRPKVAVTASAGYQYTDTNSTSGGTPNTIVRTEIHGANAPRSVGATITQNLFNGQVTANKTRSGGKPGLRRARSVAEHRTDHAADRCHHLHGLSARFRDRRGSEEQRPRARTDAEADQGPLQCRRSDAHRRRAIRGAARGRQDPAAHRRVQPGHHAIEVSPDHRQRTRGAGAGFAGRSFPASDRCRARSSSA